ncbi:MAG: GIY-YIG nuclease family protein [Chloroflexi bacterium]|nr:GIY-YIG nuclease family protein [Chloroflexota bacterium]
MNQYYVYIMSSHQGTLYIGMTNDLYRRAYEHRHKLIPGFTQKYNVAKLVYYEETSNVESAITREKQIKGWLRSKKAALVASSNPHWVDLTEAWQTLRFTQGDMSGHSSNCVGHSGMEDGFIAN